MPIAEVFIGAFITLLGEKLTSADIIRLARSVGISSKVDKLKNTLLLIQAVLADAAEKQIRDQSVQLLLNQLQHLAYEIDDVLDDLATEATRSRLNQESHATTSKVLNFIPTKFNDLKYGRKMGSKLDGITATLCDLIEKISILGLTNKQVELLPNRNRAATTKPREQTSLLPTKGVVGRESDKEALLGKLLGGESSSSQNVSVVSIVGMGGIGKTTLAQLLYNDEKVKKHFELMSWVCISENFDQLTVTKTILQDVGGDDKNATTLNQFQVALQDKLLNKRFLIVLDDVWDENAIELENFQRPFTVGAHGSKILVTTRKNNVVSAMKSVQAYSMDLLSHKEALSLFAQHASDEQNSNVDQKLELYGDEIVKKCGRLPLALKILGSAFYGKSSDEEWEKILNNEIWKFDKENEILPALKIGYYDLLPHLKQMFAYCCLFPKDYVFEKDELVLLWMAEGFLSKENGNDSMESFGHVCFAELVSRSFFQHSNNDKLSRHTMHHLIHDLATSVAGDFFFILDDRNEASKNFHHISLIREQYGMYKNLKALERTRSVRTFLAMPVTTSRFWEMFYVSNTVFFKLFLQLQFLRVLSLGNFSNITEIPQSIGGLKHLRYLNFSNTEITCLPEQVGNLHNLQSLLLSGCRKLYTLPNSIVKLSNLRHLDITYTPKLNKIPLGFGGLTGIQTLSKVIIGGSGEFRISHLKDFLHLRGKLSIEGLHEVKNALHAKEAHLQQKKGIRGLRLEWCDVFDDSRNEITEQEVLEGLRPFVKLTTLEIVYYNGTKFPNWVGDPVFDCLTQLTLRGCKSCTCLPTLGQLQSLKNLCVGSMDSMKRLGFELLGFSNSRHGVAFPSLEVLNFEDMKGWEEWSTSSGGEKVGAFPCLREMSIKNCPKLDVVAIELIPSLRVLDVQRCSLAVLKSMIGLSSSIARLTIDSINGLTKLDVKVLEQLKVVEYLNISRCDELMYMWESEAEAYRFLGGLRCLKVCYCENLVSLGEKETDLMLRVETFKEVGIEYCPKFKSYNCPNGIEKLKIWHCPSVTSLTFPRMDDPPSTLKHISLVCCENVEVSWLVNNLLSPLESLYIGRMSNIRLLPEGRLMHITMLSIWGCDNIECIPDNGYGFFPFHCLRELRITNCKNLKSFPHEQLQSLTSLEAMVIWKCQSLDDFPFPCGLWPPNLRYLEIGGGLNKGISKWGQQNFPTSLVTLRLDGGDEEKSRVVSFGDPSSSFLLPSSLTHLIIADFEELESLSEGLQHLTSLQHLTVRNCPKVGDLPETLLPSLSMLELSACPKLKKKCSTSRKGKYWPIISQISRLDLD